MSIANRLIKNFKHRSKWARKNNYDAYRLYERDIPDYPYIVDIYQDMAIISLRLKEIDLEEKKEGHLGELCAALTELGFPENLQLQKRRKIQKEKLQYQKLGHRSDEKIIKRVQEGDFIFKVNLSDYLDTGLFLDHRPLRRKLSKLELKKKKALNLFSYTCSLSVALAKAGATVTSVDMSANYLGWGEENFAFNDIKVFEHHFERANCLEYLKLEIENKNRYDVIVLDPPSFSNSKKMEDSFDIQRNHSPLLDQCYELLNPGGTLYFSNNLRSFKLESDLGFKDITGNSFDDDFKDPKLHQLYVLTKD
jgi:23S rRNA (cytosine1962-C5)-methyltransferase